MGTGTDEQRLTSHGVWSAVAALLLVFALAVQSGFGANVVLTQVATDRSRLFGQLVQYRIPDVAQRNLNDAHSQLANQGFKFQDVSEDGSNTGARIVTRTVPPAHEQGAVINRPVVVVYHRAVADSIVPSILGNDCAQARQILAQNHFALVRCATGVVTKRYAAGRINRQDPVPSSNAPPSRSVIAWIEPEPEGRPPALPVPNLIGLTCAEATSRLQRVDSGIECIVGVASGKFKAQLVQRQSPMPDSPMPSPRLVATWIEPDAPSTVPDVLGQTCDQARNTLRSAELALGSCNPGKVTGKGAPRQINAQTPSAGQKRPSNPVVQAWTEPAIMMPDLRGKSCEQARATLGRYMLILDACEPGKPDKALASGGVNAQQPPSGTAIATDRHVRVWIAPQSVEVPSVVGMSPAEARDRLSAVPLGARVAGPSANRGSRVKTQVPEAGQSVEAGALLSLQLELVIPDLRGLKCVEAERVARQFGLVGVKCDARHATNVGYPVGTVYAQIPQAGTTLDTPSVVRAQVLEPLLTVPSVVNQTAFEAARRVTAIGLKAKFDVGTATKDRVVIEAFPREESQVEKGSAVTMKTRLLIEVPNVTGLSCSDAKEKLTGLGLGFSCTSRWPVTLFSPIIDTLDPAWSSTMRLHEGATVKAIAVPDWKRIAILLAVLIISAAMLVPALRRKIIRIMRRPGDKPPTSTPRLPGITVRGEPDSTPLITIRVTDVPMEWPQINLRGESGTSRCFLNFSNKEDDNGRA